VNETPAPADDIGQAEYARGALLDPLLEEAGHSSARDDWLPSTAPFAVPRATSSGARRQPRGAALPAARTSIARVRSSRLIAPADAIPAGNPENARDARPRLALAAAAETIYPTASPDGVPNHRRALRRRPGSRRRAPTAPWRRSRDGRTPGSPPAEQGATALMKRNPPISAMRFGNCRSNRGASTPPQRDHPRRQHVISGLPRQHRGQDGKDPQ
jgi:hypothetical protein